MKHLTNPAFTGHPLPPGGFLALRFLPLLPVLLIILARHRRTERPSLLRRDWPWMAAMGLLVIPCYHLPLNEALRSPLHTGLISLLQNMSPALTYFLAVAFRQERPVRRRTMGVLVAFSGLALIFGEEVARDLLGGKSVSFSWAGAGWVLLATSAWSGYTLIGRRLARDHDPRFVFAASGTAGTTAVLALSPLLVGPDTLAAVRAMNGVDWAAWAYVSILSSFFAYWVWVTALRRYEASRLASTGNLIPLIVHLAAVVFLPEERKALTPVYLVGVLVTLSGTRLVIARPRRAR